MPCRGKPASYSLKVSKEKSVLGDKEVERVWKEHTLWLESSPTWSVSSLVVRLTSV